jgi:predicted GNAT family acetyltransferase
MYQLNSIAEIAPMPLTTQLGAIEVSTARLANKDKTEVLEFLARRPLHTVAMVGFINDNGLESKLNRGAFYGCRNGRGDIEGVALIGHATLMETTTHRALEALAEVAKTCTKTHMIMGESQRVDEFWNHYAAAGQKMRLACRELLFELRGSIDVNEEISGLRPATLEDLKLVMPVHAELALAESGVNPLEKDPQGFRSRCARRVEQGRTWVWVEDGELIFKADVISETPKVAYLEGIWVNPSLRGQRLGLRCISQLAQRLMSHTRSLCLLVNETNTAAELFYKTAGYKLRGIYDTILLA